MKRVILIAIILAATIANAQDFQFGVKAGVNISNFTGGNFDTVTNSALVGYHFGGLVRIKFDHFVIQPEVLFSTQGAKLKHAGVEADVKVNYITIPVMAQWQFNGGFYVEAGPQAAFKVKEDIPTTVNQLSTSDFAKSTDWSADFGLGYIFKSFGLGARYCVGLTKVGNGDNTQVYGDFKNGVLQFSIFYLFGVKEKKKAQ